MKLEIIYDELKKNKELYELISIYRKKYESLGCEDIDLLTLYTNIRRFKFLAQRCE